MDQVFGARKTGKSCHAKSPNKVHAQITEAAQLRVSAPPSLSSSKPFSPAFYPPGLCNEETYSNLPALLAYMSATLMWPCR